MLLVAFLDFVICFQFSCFYSRFYAPTDCVIQPTKRLNRVWEIPGSNLSRCTVLKFIILLTLGGSVFDFFFTAMPTVLIFFFFMFLSLGGGQFEF